MSDTGHASRPVNRPLNDERYNNMRRRGPSRPYFGVCADCGYPNAAHGGVTPGTNVPASLCPGTPGGPKP